MTKPVGNYSVRGFFFFFCSVPLGLDNAAFPFLAFSGIPVVSFGFYNVSISYLPAVQSTARVSVPQGGRAQGAVPSSSPMQEPLWGR